MNLDSISNECVLLLNYQQRIIYAIALRASRTFTLRFLIVGKVGHLDPIFLVLGADFICVNWVTN